MLTRSATGPLYDELVKKTDLRTLIDLLGELASEKGLPDDVSEALGRVWVHLVAQLNRRK